MIGQIGVSHKKSFLLLFIQVRHFQRHLPGGGIRPLQGREVRGKHGGGGDGAHFNLHNAWVRA